MTWTKELPTKPGLYPFTAAHKPNYTACMVVHRLRGCSQLFVFDLASDGGTFMLTQLEGMWGEEMTIELPAPYVPPEPPVVEWYTAAHFGARRWLMKVGDFAHAFDMTLLHSNNGSPVLWTEISEHYTDIQRVEP